MGELDKKTYEAIKKFSAAGDELAAADRYRDALDQYKKAWELIPAPKREWNASTWVLAAIGDTAYLGGFLQSAREALDYAMLCPGAIGNPFLHLRRGQVLFDQEEYAAAADELIRAYMGAGPEIFDPEPPKYLQFLRTRADIP